MWLKSRTESTLIWILGQADIEHIYDQEETDNNSIVSNGSYLSSAFLYHDIYSVESEFVFILDEKMERETEIVSTITHDILRIFDKIITIMLLFVLFARTSYRIIVK